MPSNKVLSKQAVDLAATLGTVAEVSGLNNAALVKLVADLKIKVRALDDAGEGTDDDAGEGTDDDAGEGTDDDAGEPEEVKAHPYRVKAGKAVTSKRGILGEGEEVKAEYLPGGKSTLDELINRGFVVKG